MSKLITMTQPITKRQFRLFFPKNIKKSAIIRYMEKPILVNFVNFSKIVCDLLTFLTANNKNNKQCLIDGMGFIVQ